jgi:nanoRNase/pAp phosphatase (c-di-AMP/oligoRNAs hydrolase)
MFETPIKSPLALAFVSLRTFWYSYLLTNKTHGKQFKQMPLQNEQQFFELIDKSKKILIPLPENPKPDAVGSALALGALLKKIGKEPEIRSLQKDFEPLGFLPGITTVTQGADFRQTFVISVSMEHAKVDEISYQASAHNSLEINVTAASGIFSKDDVSFNAKFGGYDLIITVDTPSLEFLGELYSKNAEMFFNTPKISIDNSIRNDQYANVSIVDITASSTAEIIYALFKEKYTESIDADIATNLLAGIIAETNSFQNPLTTPASFETAAALIGLGGRQQEIIQHLFKTKELSVLKLWGRAMARIKNIPEYGAVYSVVSKQDIEKSQIKAEDLLKVAQEFVKNVADPKILLFMYEVEKGIDAYVYTNPNIHLQELANELGGKMLQESLALVHFPDSTIESIDGLIHDTLGALKGRLGL